ncbi:MAG: cardiolipin synthase [Phycisphaerales bacterium]|nr:MAG: cardiolipin synthase [Phycisphaerales bacterium]
MLEWISNHPWLAASGLLVEFGLRVLMGFVVIARRRPVPTTLAWLVLVLFVPLIGSILYVLVGENRLGTRRRMEHDQIMRQAEPSVVARWAELGLTRSRPSVRSGGLELVAPHATAVGGLPPLKGNRLTLLSDTDEFLDSLIRDIDASTHHCHLLFYIWMARGRSEEISAALVRASQRGVECRVLVDSAGSKEFLASEQRRMLDREGVRVLEALPVGALRMLVARLDLRNHRKIAVFDGRVGYMGSQNLTDHGFKRSIRKKIGPWIDASVRVEGPAAQALQLVFLRDWALETDEDVHLEDTYLPRVSIGDVTDGRVAQVVPTGPGPDAGAMRDALLSMIYGARQELIVTTPYFVPDDATETALISAARRGVRVTLVLPRHSDAIVVAAAGRWTYEALLRAGVRVVEFTDGLLHSKTVTADRCLSLIGSANIDIRSFLLNFEVSLFVYDAAFAEELARLQESYIEKSERITLGAWKQRPFGRRAAQGFARLLGPLL